MQLRPHPSYSPLSPLPFFTVPDSPLAACSSTAPACQSSSAGLGSVAATDSGTVRDPHMESGFASGRYSTHSFTHAPQYTPDLQTGFVGALSYSSIPRSHACSAGTIRSANLARASSSDTTSLLPKSRRRAGGSSSEFASVSAPASPSHMGQQFSGYPRAWGNVHARVGSSSSLNDLPLSVRAGESSSMRTAGGGGSRGMFLPSQGDAASMHMPGSESMAALDNLSMHHNAAAREEPREEGHVKFAIYWEFLTAVGWPAVFAVVTALVAMQLVRTLTDVYVTLWSGDLHAGHTRPPGVSLRHEWTSESTSAFLRGLGALTAVSLVATIARAFLFANAGLKAAESLHTRLMDSCAPVWLLRTALRQHKAVLALAMAASSPLSALHKVCGAA